MIDTFLKRFPGAPTILVVEDEGVLREMERGLLEHYGFNVLEADSGRRAYDLWRAEGEKVDLLFVDIVLPRGITGVELAKRLLDGQPNLKIIFTTGRVLPHAEEQALAQMNARFLPKPFEQEALVHLVRDTLGLTDSGEANAGLSVA
ncbi:MAG TPA: response regulator [Pseudomonadales bacterium]|nr:response regulator [Pseudomonadales bacterium]